MINVVIVEDNVEDCSCLKKYVAHYMKDKNILFEIYTYKDGNGLIFDYKPIYDIMLLDIEMPGMNGMQIAEKIRMIDKKVIIFFITNMAQYAIKGYKVNARSYLLKPVNYYELEMEFDSIMPALVEEHSDFILLRGNEGLMKVSIAEIMYIESQKHQIIVHLKDRCVTCRGTMKVLEEQFSKYCFERCNVSYLVNLSYVKGIKKDMVLIGNEFIPISRNKKKNFMSALISFIGGVVSD